MISRLPLALPGLLPMHGIGGRTDLPLPTWLAVSGAVLAVALTFVAVSLHPPAPRDPDTGGRPVPAPVQRVLDSPRTRTALAASALLLTVFVTVVALTGPAVSGRNLAPYALYITFWVGLVPASLLFGPVVRVVNPLRLVHRGISRLLRRDPALSPVPMPGRWGLWPAAVWLSVFLWLELVFPDRGLPTTVGAFLVLYAAGNLAAAQLFGSGWFGRGDGFEVYSTLVATLSPLGRRADGRIVVRNPVDGVIALRPQPGLVAVVVILVGSTAFDGVTRTRYWVENIPPDSIPLGTAGLAGTTLAVAWLYYAAMVAGARLAHRVATEGSPVDGAAAVPLDGRVTAAPARAVAAEQRPAATVGRRDAGGHRSPAGRADDRGPVRHAGTDAESLASLFAVSLVPIAVGYSIAHYASLFFYEGQGTWILLSDPFDTGANLFGTRVDAIDYTWISAGTVAYIQIGAIVLGHVVAVLIAHYQANSAFDERTAKRIQYPHTALMLLLTGAAVTLLINT